MENHNPDKKPAKKIYLLIALVSLVILVISYMYMADPPSPWIFVIPSAAVLFSIGTAIYRKRKGHFS